MPLPSVVECVPNFSTSDPKIIQALVDGIESVKYIRVWDYSSDKDHNRSVITFGGPPDLVIESAFRAVAKAAELIDMRQHKGVHPRLGATDVVPFVPLQNVTMDDCISLSHQLGSRIGKELQLPVYLYAHAAKRPDRRQLADIRRGEYEMLQQSISSDPDRAPDYGPAMIGGAGAVVVGARKPLIAYNVYLTTDDTKIAQKIARKIRYSSGGLPHVQAIGLYVNGQAQVSMNLTDYEITPIHIVLDAIRHEVTHYDVQIDRSELIGLMPQDAMIQAARWYLQLNDFDMQSLIESHFRSLNPDTPTE